jgi:hypothetical protein
MIRDPSDGSVREPKPGEPRAEKSSGAHGAQTGPVIETTTSGLPTPSTRDSDRHERSRKWLADYRAGKFKPHGQTE